MLKSVEKIVHADVAEVDPLGSAPGNDSDIVNSQNIQDQPQVLRGDVAVANRRTLLIDTAGGQQHGGSGVAHQTAAIHAECNALTHDMVDPRLERGGHVVVVDRRSDHQMVGCQQLSDEFVRLPWRRLRLIGLVFRRREVGLQPGSGDERQFTRGGIAFDDLAFGMDARHTSTKRRVRWREIE